MKFKFALFELSSRVAFFRRTRDLGEPRDLSRVLRQTKRAFDSLPYSNGDAVVLFLLLTILAIAPTTNAGEIVDRIVATVNGHIILQSDWQDAISYESLVDHRPLGQVSATERKAALDQLIDQELLREQMRESDFRHATDDEIAKQIEQIRQQYPEASTDADWDALLARYGLTRASLKRRAERQLDVTHLVDARLRPGVKIDSATIESYYNQEILPQLRQSGAPQVPLAEVTPKIKEVLTEKKVNELLVAWLQNLRSGSDIRTEPAQFQGTLQ